LRTSVKRFSKSLAAGITAGALAVSGLAVAFTAITASPAFAATTSRIGGANRYDTARLAALANFPGGSPSAVLASGENFPDGLAAADLAGSLAVPLLLTPAASLAPETVSALATLKVKTVYVVGGTAAVSAAVITQLQGLGYTVPAAIAGADRYATAAAVATASTTFAGIGTLGGKKTAIIASGANFPDALAAGSAAYQAHFPILLTDPNTLSAATSAEITSLGVTNVLIAGGTAAVSTAVETSLKALASGALTTTRLAGADRFATSVAIATFDVNAAVSGGLGMSTANAILASGLNFPDALVASEFKAPVVLDDPLPASVAAWLAGAGIGNIIALGGTAAVPDADLTAAGTAGTPTAGTAVISGAVAGGTSFIVTFSAAAQVVNLAGFLLNNAAIPVGAVSVSCPAPANAASPCISQTGLSTYLVHGLLAPLNPGDIISFSGTPPTNTAGLGFTATAVTVAANAAPTVVSTQFYVGGTALAITFSKPVKFVAGAVTVTGGTGAVALPATTVSADGLTYEFANTGAAFNGASTLTVVGGITGAVPNGVADLSAANAGLGVPMAANYSALASTNNVAPVISLAHLTVGNPQLLAAVNPGPPQGSASVTLALPATDTMVITAKAGSAADGASDQNFQVAFAAAAGNTLSVTSAVIPLGTVGGCVATATSCTRFTVTPPKVAGVYPTAVALAAGLNATAPFNTLFVANATGLVDTSTSIALAAVSLANGWSSYDVAMIFSKQLVPAAALQTPANFAFNSGAGAVVIKAPDGLDNVAAPQIVRIGFLTSSANGELTAGTSTVTYTGGAVDFANNAYGAGVAVALS